MAYPHLIALPLLLGIAGAQQWGLHSACGSSGLQVELEFLLYIMSGDAGRGPILGKGRLCFATLAVRAVVNSRLASRLPPWPREAGQDWRDECFRCRRTALQRLPAPCGAVA